MNNKEFIETLADRVGLDTKDTQRFVENLMDSLVTRLEDEELTISGFGTFEVKKKNERVIVHPSTGNKMLVPPKLVLTFKQSSTLKNKTKKQTAEERS